MEHRNRKRIRLEWCDYTEPGFYFVTMCTKDRVHYFGEIKNGTMIPNDLGTYTNEHITQIPTHYPSVKTHEYIVMPNHIHIIIEIDKNNMGIATEIRNYFPTNTRNAMVGQNFHFANANNDANVNNNTNTNNNTNINSDSDNDSKKQIQPKSWSLSSIVRWFKIDIVKFAKEHNIIFARQPRFHDHIIRDEKSRENITHYIKTNPENREEDIFMK